ncbi:hypothetical protein ACSFA0_22490 [Variovorax sp. LT1P1]|uniref:hypothetical protein n=1 Tax=Variovorax sp. LT1P1 TaxID=3443730 RepID=UPI003F483F3B
MMESPSIRPPEVQAAGPHAPAGARRELLALLQERPIRLDDALRLVDAATPAPSESMSTAFSPVVSEIMQTNAIRLDNDAVAVSGRAIVERILQCALQREGAVFSLESRTHEEEEVSWSQNGRWDESCRVETTSVQRTNLLTEVLGYGGNRYGDSVEAWLDLIGKVYGSHPVILQDAIKEARERARSAWWATYDDTPIGGFRVLMRGWLGSSDHRLTLEDPVRAEAQHLASWEDAEMRRITTIPLIEVLARAFDPSFGVIVAKQLAATGIDLDSEVDVEDGTQSGGLRLGARATGSWRGTLLHRAISHGNSDLVADLLMRGCDPRKEASVRPLNAPHSVISLGDGFDALADRLAAVTEEPHVRHCAEIQALLQNWEAHNRARSVLAQIEAEHGDQASTAASARGMRLP